MVMFDRVWFGKRIFYAARELRRIGTLLAPPYEPEAVEADMFLGVGPNCRVAANLRKNGLRRASYPLDWMTNYSLADALRLFASGFAGFFRDVRETGEENSLPHRPVIDLANGMLSLHHFRRDLPWADARIDFQSVMGKRIRRMYEQLETDKNVCLVTARPDTLDDLARFAQGMARICKGGGGNYFEFT